MDDTQAPPLLVHGQPEYELESILAARWKTIQGGHNRRQLLVKWKDYAVPTWEPIEEHDDSAALDEFEAAFGNAWENDGPLRTAPTPSRPRRRKEREEGVM